MTTRSKLEEALDAVKEIFPDTGIIILTAQPTGDGMNINSASNISRQGQLILMLDVTGNFISTFAADIPSSDTAH